MPKSTSMLLPIDTKYENPIFLSIAIQHEVHSAPDAK